MSDERNLTGQAGAANEDAAGWFVRLQSEATDGDDWLAFEAWLKASPANVEAYDRIERIWLDLDPPAGETLQPSEPAGFPRRSRPVRTAARPSRRAWTLGAGGALAAGLLAAVVVAGRPEVLTLTTAPGETRAFTLSDGTRINLNAASTLRVEMGRSARRVVMADAEGVFDVAHDARRPFLIEAGDSEVRVVGTLFNLRQRGDRLALSVQRGVVEVRPAGEAGGAAARVTAGQQLSHSTGGPSTLVQDGQADAAFGWTRGQLVARDEPLGEVAADISRRFGTPVGTADAATAALRFSGVLMLDDEAAVLRRVEAFAPVRAERTAKGVVLRRRAHD